MTAKIPSLDGLRAVSILLVAVSHCGFGNIIPGGLGVTIFFFLSGYLITTLLQEEYSKTLKINVFGFFKRRFIRLSPPFILTLVVACAMVIAGLLHGRLKVEGALAQLLYFANYYAVFWQHGESVAPGTEVFWSLAVEEHFYLFYPLIVFVMLKTLSQRQMMLVLGGMCLAILAWRCDLVLVFHAATKRTYYATDTRIDSILYGCIFAIWVKSLPDSFVDSFDKKRALGWLCCTVGLLSASLLVRNAVFRETFRYSLQGVALMPLFAVLILHRNGLMHRMLNNEFLANLGQHSYSFYLIHLVIMNVIVQHFKEIGRVELLSLVVVISYAYAWLVGRYVETPMRALRNVKMRAMFAGLSFRT